MMLEWLDGYWTAMRHVANAAPNVSKGGSVTEWLSAFGSAGAAIAAAVAAGLSWKVAQKSSHSAVQIERAVVLQMSNDLLMELSQRSFSSEAALIEHRFQTFAYPHLQLHWDKIKSELEKLGPSYRNLATKAVGKGIVEAQTLDELQTIRISLSTVRLEMFSIDKTQQKCKFLADKLQKGIAYNISGAF